jgi:ribosomal-protein-alanine N-acetyltransferase
MQGRIIRNEITSSLIRLKATGTILGMIDILSPKLIRDHYKLSEYPYFIEFYIKREAQNNSLTIKILPRVIKVMKEQGIVRISAVADKRNFPAKKVLIK